MQYLEFFHKKDIMDFMRLKILPVFLILTMFAVSIVGLTGISLTDHVGNHTCSVLVFAGGDCPSGDGAAALAFHHVLGLQSFMQSIINSNTFLLALSILLGFASIYLLRFLRQMPAPHFLYNRICRKITEHIPNKKFLRWLALRYKRDPHAPISA